jgi:hypothetical protein
MGSSDGEIPTALLASDGRARSDGEFAPPLVAGEAFDFSREVAGPATGAVAPFPAASGEVERFWLDWPPGWASDPPISSSAIADSMPSPRSEKRTKKKKFGKKKFGTQKVWNAKGVTAGGKKAVAVRSGQSASACGADWAKLGWKSRLVVDVHLGNASRNQRGKTNQNLCWAFG